MITTGFLVVQAEAELPEGFVSIFNGKDLTDWKGSPEYWSVEDGKIVGVTDGSLDRNRFLIYEGEPVKNFELRAKVRITKGGNSGLQYRSRERPELGEWVLSGYQCDVLPAAQGLNGMFYEEEGRRILARTGEKVKVDPFGMSWVVGQMEVKEFPPGVWRDYRVLVQGNHHQHWIDGHPTADAIDGDLNGRSLEGLLGVQVHVGPAMKVEYRDLWLKRLPNDLPLIEPAIEASAYRVRPQQPLPQGWVASKRGEFVRSLFTEQVTWGELSRPGCEGEVAFSLKKLPQGTLLRAWFGSDDREQEFKVEVNGEIAFSQKRVNPTWQLMEIALEGDCSVVFSGQEGTFWAEATLWEISEK